MKILAQVAQPLPVDKNKVRIFLPLRRLGVGLQAERWLRKHISDRRFKQMNGKSMFKSKPNITKTREMTMIQVDVI